MILMIYLASIVLSFYGMTRFSYNIQKYISGRDFLIIMALALIPILNSLIIFALGVERGILLIQTIVDYVGGLKLVETFLTKKFFEEKK